jgi:hypothetical protein
MLYSQSHRIHKDNGIVLLNQWDLLAQNNHFHTTHSYSLTQLISQVTKPKYVQTEASFSIALFLSQKICLIWKIDRIQYQARLLRYVESKLRIVANNSQNRSCSSLLLTFINLNPIIKYRYKGSYFNWSFSGRNFRKLSVVIQIHLEDILLECLSIWQRQTYI